MDEPIHLRAWVDGDVGPTTRVVCEAGPETGDATVRAEATAVEMRDPPAIDAASDWTHFQRG
jgi:hypothetical protein